MPQKKNKRNGASDTLKELHKKIKQAVVRTERSLMDLEMKLDRETKDYERLYGKNNND